MAQANFSGFQPFTLRAVQENSPVDCFPARGWPAGQRIRPYLMEHMQKPLQIVDFLMPLWYHKLKLWEGAYSYDDGYDDCNRNGW